MKSNKGFSLIELMVAVAVVGIISVIAIPAYTTYSMRGRIPEATSTLSTTRIAIEQYFLDNHTYVGADTAGICTQGNASSKYFTFSCSTLTASTYTIQATGKGSMTGFTYTIDQSNTKQTTAAPGAWGPTSSTCWIINTGGAC